MLVDSFVGNGVSFLQGHVRPAPAVISGASGEEITMGSSGSFAQGTQHIQSRTSRAVGIRRGELMDELLRTILPHPHVSAFVLQAFARGNVRVIPASFMTDMLITNGGISPVPLHISSTTSHLSASTCGSY
jgi:hypothetical protein